MKIQKRYKGFTLIELMVAIVVMSIALMVAVPSFEYVTERNRISSNTNLLIGAVNMARVEATKRGRRINVGVLNTTTGQWGIWMDEDADDAYDAGEEIRVFDALPESLDLDASADTYTFLPTGFALAAGTMDLCPVSDSKDGTQISIALSGRVQSATLTCP